MNRLKSSVLLVLAGLGAVILSVEIGFLRREQMHARKALAALEQKKQERDRLSQQAPAPSKENQRIIADALAEAAGTLAALRDELAGYQPEVPAPAGTVEAFFELSRFVTAMKGKAAEGKVAVRPGERFGFGSYVTEGPAAAVLPAVHRQRTTAGSIIEALFEARPLALLAFKRERPDTTDANKPERTMEDYFILPHEYSLRQPGLMNTDAFRVEFTGQTAVLRQFLNTLAGSPQAMVVRTVEVEPFSVATAGAPGAEAGALHRPPISKFVVTLEIPLIARPGSLP